MIQHHLFSLAVSVPFFLVAALFWWRFRYRRRLFPIVVGFSMVLGAVVHGLAFANPRGLIYLSPKTWGQLLEHFAGAVAFGRAVCAFYVVIVLCIFSFNRHAARQGGAAEPPTCGICGYDLRGLPQNRCPECGTPFTREAASPITKST